MKYRSNIVVAGRGGWTAVALGLGLISFPATAQTSPANAAGENADGTIVVTATRSRQSLKDVPISVQAFTSETMEKQGIKQFSDLVRFTPGLTFNQTEGGRNDISIRGVASSAGASTTGIYLDDIPIQVRQVGYSAGEIFPEIFDLERVEVLRGPQGTLFGAGSEGGTVRFILPQPSLDKFTGYVRGEGSITPDAAGSYEGGVAIGGPIVTDKIGFRASAFYRRDGGWIDRVPGTFTLVDPTGASYGKSATFTPTGRGDRNANWVGTQAYRLALKLAPTESLTITPSVFYQKQNIGDTTLVYWPSASDPDHGRFVVPQYTAGPASPATGLTQMSLPNDEEGRTNLLVAALSVEQDLGFASLYSTSSYLRQHKRQLTDFTTDYETAYTGQQFAAPGAKAQNLYVDRQQNFTQEVRLQSNGDSRLNWTVGGFYIHAHQYSYQLIEENTFFYANSFFGIPNLDNGSPFGPGYNNYQNIWGAPLTHDGSGEYEATIVTREQQLAGFAQADFKLTHKLILTAGVRVSREWLTYSMSSAGPENNLNAPYGAPCPTGPVCPYGSGAFAPHYAGGQQKSAETATTPKFGARYVFDRNNMIYTTISKGFRPGGAQTPLPSNCDTGLREYGYVDSNGNTYTPLTYKSDTVWNYEIGSKNRFLNGLIDVNTSAYIIKWKNIQNIIKVPVCGINVIDNFGSATVKGFDLSLQIRPIRSLTLGLSAGYTDASFDHAQISPTGGTILSKGSAVTNSGPPWQVTVSGEYDGRLNDELGGYLRVDYTYSSRERRTGNTDPATLSYDPLLFPNPAVNLVNARIGITRDGADLSLFVNNVFDVHPVDNISRYPNYLYFARTLRPRSIGITGSYRF